MTSIRFRCGSGGFVTFLVFNLLQIIPLHAQVTDWDAAEKDIRKLEPKVFTELPTEIRKLLEEEGCLIPQTFLPGKPHNVIQGEFAKKGQKDWAVLCAKERMGSIRVFWGGPISCPEPFKETRLKGSLQGLGHGKIGFSMKLDTASTHYVESTWGESKPNHEVHEGIESYFLEKASVVLYCHEGKWLRLDGAD